MKGNMKTYSVAQAKEILHIQNTAMYALLHSGALKASKTGKKYVIYEEAIIAYLKANEV